MLLSAEIIFVRRSLRPGLSCYCVESNMLSRQQCVLAREDSVMWHEPWSSVDYNALALMVRLIPTEAILGSHYGRSLDDIDILQYRRHSPRSIFSLLLTVMDEMDCFIVGTGYATRLLFYRLRGALLSMPESPRGCLWDPVGAARCTATDGDSSTGLAAPTSPNL